MRFVAMLLLLLVPAWADDITVGAFSESGTKRFDYSLIYVVGRTQVAGVPIRVQIDQFTGASQLRRIWINVGEFALVDTKQVALSFSPGVIVTDDRRAFLGGTLSFSYKPLGLSIIYKPAASGTHDRHLLFTNVQLTKEWGIQHYLYTEKGYSADSYVGPVFSKGSVYVWAGASLNRPGAWSVNSEITIKF